MDLPDHPWFANDVMAPAPDLLGELAGARDDDRMTAFLFGAVPFRVLGDLLTSAPDRLPVPEYLWLMHLSGYFGGVWLRGEIAAAQPEAPLVQFSVEPDAEAFAGLVDVMAAGVAASRGDDATALAHSAEQLDAQADGYGYNRGYLLEILETPPAGLASPAGFLVVDGVLGARYSVAELPGLDALRSRWCDRAGASGDLPARLAAIEAEADQRGRTVWSTGLSVQGFPQAEYEVLLDLSAYFLQATQAVALGHALAVVEGDAGAARTAALVGAALAPWSRSYMMGLLDGRPDRRLPAFTA